MYRNHRTSALIAFLLAASSLSACGNDVGPMAPDVPEVAGGWQGSAVDTFDFERTVSVFLEQDGTQITGTVTSMIFRTTSLFPLSGTVDEEGRVTVTVLAADAGGCFDVTITVALSTSRRRLSGGYVINRRADGCGRESIPPQSRPFSIER
jgi:hypothetical protein